MALYAVPAADISVLHFIFQSFTDETRRFISVSVFAAACAECGIYT